jgi:hypothetical protein
MSAHVDDETFAIWGEAMCDALVGDRRELVDLLRHGNKMTRDLAEFLAWLLDERESHRPTLPAKFKVLNQMARNPKLFDAVMDFEMERANWYCRKPWPPHEKMNRRRFPYEEKLQQVARRWGVHRDTLENSIRRSAHSGKKLGL